MLSINDKIFLFPYGDGNSVMRLVSVAYSSVVKNLNPRKGTETSASFTFKPSLKTKIPGRGRKLKETLAVSHSAETLVKLKQPE